MRYIAVHRISKRLKIAELPLRRKKRLNQRILHNHSVIQYYGLRLFSELALQTLNICTIMDFLNTIHVLWTTRPDLGLGKIKFSV